MEKEKIIKEILEREWVFFQMAQNTGGRASCQDNKEEFVIMRESQWKTLPLNVLESYLEDLEIAEQNRQNIVVEKYARMMKYSTPDEYEKIKEILDGWTYERLGTLEKVLLKISFYEITIKKIGYEIAINEAVELAKKYSYDDTKEFLNGILAKLVKQNNA